VKWDTSRVWQALGVALASTCISIGGPSMQGSGRWGQELNVKEPYLFRSQAFILALFSGVHGNGSSDGRGGGASRSGTSMQGRAT